MAVNKFVEYERNRKRGMAMLKQGKNPTEVSRALGVSRQTVYNWKERGFGEDAVIGCGGRPSKLNPEQQKRLLKLLEQPPSSFGIASSTWTAPRIGDLIQKEFGIDLHPHWIPQMMRRLGWSSRKPRQGARPKSKLRR